MLFQNLVVIGLSSLLSMTCQTFVKAPSTTKSMADRSHNVVLKPIAAGLRESDHRVVDLTRAEINIKERTESGRIIAQQKIDKVQFAGARTGWAGTTRSLYRTSDGGKTWQNLKLAMRRDSQISSFFFVDERLGWLSLVDTTVDQPAPVSLSHIMITRDGGNSWSEQAAALPTGALISEIKFLTPTNGLAVGGRIVNASEESFAVSTHDGGETWKNISDGINSTTIDDYSRPVSNISWANPSQILLLLRGGKLISSSNGGGTWQNVVQFEDERPDGSVSSTGYYKILLDPRLRIRALAGAMGEEGYWGNLLTQDDHDSWVSYELVRVPILDAIFLSEGEIVASGWEIRVASKIPESELPAVGIILHSADGGKTWSVVHRSNLNERFISITKVSDNHFYAVSDAGTLVRFSLRKT